MAKNEVVVETKVVTGDSAAKIEEVSKSTDKLNDNLKETQKEAKETEKKLDKATDAVGRMPGPIGSAVDGFKGMVNSFKAIIASPVGIVLAAVAVVVGSLVAIFSKFSPIVDFLSDKIALLTGAFSGLQNQVISFIQGTGFSTEKIKEQALAMQEAERMARDYEDSLSALNLTQAQQERAIDVNLKKLKNKNITEKESNAIIQQTINIQKQQIDDLQKNQQVETEILKKKVLGYGGTYKQILAIVKGSSVAQLNTGNEDLDKALITLQENYGKRINAVSSYEQKYEKIQNFRDAQEIKFNTKRENERKAAEEQRKKEAEQAAKLLELNEKQQKDREDAVKTGFDKTSKLTEEYYKKQTTDILNQNLTTEQSKKALDELELKRLNQQLENAKMYGQSTVDLELQLAQKKANINKEATDAQKKLDEEALKQKEKDAEAQKKLDEEVAANRVKSLESASNTLKTFANVLGETTAEGKALAVAAATIDTYKAAQSAYASLAGVPVVGPALGAAAAAAAIASGLATVNKILSVQVPNSSGGGSVPSAPPMTRPSSSFTRIDNSTPLDVNNTGATKVYVTETDITNTQKKVDAIKAKAVIG
jgi:hypothetical protein